MSQPTRRVNLSEDEIRAVYRQGEDAVVSLVTQLDVAAPEGWLSHQVFDIPAIELMATEHQVAVKCCSECGQHTQGEFPMDARNMVQYGPRLKGMMVYLMDGQLLPSAQTREVLRDLLGVSVSEGTLYTSRSQCFEQLKAIEQEIQESLINASTVHFDETGLRVNGKLWWLHVACTDGLTYYFAHPKRGQIAMDDMAILPAFSGKAIHDGWKSYGGYDCEHFLCNAHHLRELRYVLEHDGQEWAYQLSLLLVTMLGQVQAAQAQGQTALPLDQVQAFEKRYADILDQGLAANPIPTPPPGEPRKRGRPKRSPPRKLLEQLQSQHASVLGFMIDFEVPFDNNQAERDIRIMKLKQKISGCFRSADGAHMFCRIRGDLSTLRKQKQPILDALIAVLPGQPGFPTPQPE